MSEVTERDWLRLTLAPGLGPTRLRRCIDHFGSPLAVFEAGATQLAQIKGISTRLARELRNQLDRTGESDELAAEQRLIEQHGVHLLTCDDPAYPALLRHIPDAPPLLYVRGRFEAEDALALAVVGARRCTHYGREQTQRLATLCSQSGLCIVSGGAYGVDAVAHRAALEAGGRTAAVLGSGLAKPYPPQHAELFDQIAAGRGAVVSELPMTFPPMAENFPRRNRIISGLALGVLVIEASSRSGALITARLAAEEQGREVMALPGRVDSPASAGCHKMIRESWATLVTSSGDVLDALGETGQLLKARAGGQAAGQSGDGDDGRPTSLFEQNLTDSQRKIFDALSAPQALDQLAAATGMAVQAVQADLTMLEIRGVIRKEGTTFAGARSN